MVKGCSHNLMKLGSKRRMGKQELKEKKRMESHRQHEITEKLSHIKEMEHQLNIIK